MAAVRKPIVALILIVALATAPAAAMLVAQFLTKAEALQARGMMALFSPDLGVLKAETMDAFKAWRA